MLTTFIVIAVLMCLVACAAVGLPLWFGKKDEGEANRREMTLNILRQQAEDLEEDRKAGRIDEDEYEETRLELEDLGRAFRRRNVAHHRSAEGPSRKEPDGPRRLVHARAHDGLGEPL